jgi:hypothetical protein
MTAVVQHHVSRKAKRGILFSSDARKRPHLLLPIQINSSKMGGWIVQPFTRDVLSFARLRNALMGLCRFRVRREVCLLLDHREEISQRRPSWPREYIAELAYWYLDADPPWTHRGWVVLELVWRRAMNGSRRLFEPPLAYGHILLREICNLPSRMQIARENRLTHRYSPLAYPYKESILECPRRDNVLAVRSLYREATLTSYPQATPVDLYILLTLKTSDRMAEVARMATVSRPRSPDSR